MDEGHKLTAGKACNYYGEAEDARQYANDMRCNEHEMNRRDENMEKLKKFQADIGIAITPEQENQYRKWICEGFSFSRDFNICSDDVIPIDENCGYCYLDYLLTDSEEFRMEVDEYRIRCLLDSLYDNADRCRELLRDLQFMEMHKHLMERPNTYSISEISGCTAWLNDGHGFWNNPFKVRNALGNEENYMEALHGLNKK